MKERRKHPRISMNGLVEVWGEQTNAPLRGYVNDISLSGISFCIREIFAPGATVVFSLHFSGENQLEFIKALGARVVSCSKSGKSFQLRARFLEPITLESEPVLFAYLTSKKKPINFGYRFRDSINLDGGSILERTSNVTR